MGNLCGRVGRRQAILANDGQIGCCRRVTGIAPHSGLHGQSGARSSFVASKSSTLALNLVLAACRAPLPASGANSGASTAPLQAALAPGQEPEQLALTSALPIDAGEHFQPSGLALEDGRLLTVSDHEDGAIYQLVLGETAAEARPYVTFSVPEDAAGVATPGPGRSSGRLDFEGLVALGGGRFWILSEGPVSRARGGCGRRFAGPWPCTLADRLGGSQRSSRGSISSAWR
jgi:hypothetical protein